MGKGRKLPYKKFPPLPQIKYIMQAFDRNKLAGYLSRFDGKRLFVIGDLMLDRYLKGSVNRISPEAPVQVLNVKHETDCLGGSGNVINNLCALGAKVLTASVVGDDDTGRNICGKLEELGISTENIFFEPGRITPLKTRLMASHQQIVRFDKENTDDINAESEEKIISSLKRLIEEDGIDGILISDYMKGVLTRKLLRDTIDLCRKQGLPVIIDPKGNDYTKYTGATILTPNQKEAEQASGISLRSENDITSAGNKLYSDLKLDALLITRGEHGMSLFTGLEKVDIKTEARDVYDVTGAGDTVLALIGLGLTSGISFKESALIANLAAGVVVGKLGASVVYRDEILRYFDEIYQGTNNKIYTNVSISELLQKLRRQNKKVVFTNGCFDLLHVGHITFLKKAKRLGDFLIIGINSDQSIKRIKGNNRPIIPENDREHILSSLEFVDAVVRFNEDTPELLIKEIKPDIVVKGGSHKLEDVVGREFVEEYGGKVMVIEASENISVTGIIERINNSR